MTVTRLRVEPLGAAALEAGAPLCTLECRGCEPVGFQAGDGWVVAVESGASWEASFDEEDSFTEFDEGAGVPVTAENVRGEWRKD